MARNHMFEVTWCTWSNVTGFFAIMFFTTKKFITFVCAYEVSKLVWTFYFHFLFTAAALDRNSLEITRWAFSFMASKRAQMRTIWSSFLLTIVPTTVWRKLAIILWVFVLSTKAIIFWHLFRILIFALWTTPV